MWWLWILYVTLIGVIIYLSIVLTNFIEQLERRTKASGALLSGVILAAATSLPELFTSISATLLLNEPAMSYNNILGSNFFNLAILCFFIVVYARLVRKRRVSKASGVFLSLGLILTVLVFIYTFLPENFMVIPFININTLSFIILACYIISIISTRKKEDTREENRPFTASRLSVRTIIILFIVVSFLVIGVSIATTYVVNAISIAYGMDKGFAGALFLGIGTSLPEAVACVTFIKRGNFDLALGDIAGSNMFNLAILVVADILSFGGTVFMQDLSASLISGISIIAIAMLLSLYLFKRKRLSFMEKRWPYYIFAGVPVVCYIVYIVLASGI